MTAHDVVSDSAGVSARLTPMYEVRAGDAITEGWKPWLVVERVEFYNDMARMHFVSGHTGQWREKGSLVPVEVVA